MILSYADLKDPAKFVCPWHRAEGGRCGQSLAGASVIIVPGVRKFVSIEELIEKADAGDSQVFWCPHCEGAIVIAPVEQGFKVGIPV